MDRYVRLDLGILAVARKCMPWLGCGISPGRNAISKIRLVPPGANVDNMCYEMPIAYTLQTNRYQS